MYSATILAGLYLFFCSSHVYMFLPLQTLSLVAILLSLPAVSLHCCSQIQTLRCLISGSYCFLLPQVASSQPVCRTSAQSIFLDCFPPSQNLVSRMFSLFLSGYCYGLLDFYFVFSISVHLGWGVIARYICGTVNWNREKSCRLISENSDWNPGKKVVLVLGLVTLCNSAYSYFDKQFESLNCKVVTHGHSYLTESDYQKYLILGYPAV